MHVRRRQVNTLVWRPMTSSDGKQRLRSMRLRADRSIVASKASGAFLRCSSCGSVADFDLFKMLAGVSLKQDARRTYDIVSSIDSGDASYSIRTGFYVERLEAKHIVALQLVGWS